METVSVVARIEDKCADPASELESIGGEHGNSGEVSGILAKEVLQESLWKSWRLSRRETWKHYLSHSLLHDGDPEDCSKDSGGLKKMN